MNPRDTESRARKLLCVASAICASAVALPSATAQVRDTVETRGFARPTVFVVLDSSGSMEFLPTVRETQDDCSVYDENTGSWTHTAATGSVPPAMNRYGTAVEVLVGGYPGNTYCAYDDRNSDRDGDAVPAYSEMGFHWRSDDPDTQLGARPQGFQHINYCASSGLFGINPVQDCNPSNLYPQLGDDGVLDGPNRDELNFIFAAYDSLEATGTGSGGMFSYGLEHTASEEGMNINLGIRNRGAFGQGRLIQPFTPLGENIADRHAINTQIQQSIAGITAYGGTPIGAVLRDVDWFYRNDYSVNPPSGAQTYDDGTGTGNQQPGIDAYGECRPRNLVLITDGVDSYATCDRAEAARCTANDQCASGLCAASGYCACDSRAECASGVTCVAETNGVRTCHVPGCQNYDLPGPGDRSPRALRGGRWCARHDR